MTQLLVIANEEWEHLMYPILYIAGQLRLGIVKKILLRYMKTIGSLCREDDAVLYNI